MAPTAIPEYKGPIYSATYSGVPVFEFIVEDNQIMRRRSDDWINATHILKVADFDKPARTRILEREVQKGVHEKIQGGYGKYQGTWVPLHDGRLLAERNGVLDKLRPIFDFVHKDRDKSPPQAPKHTTAASNKPRVPKAAAVRRAPKAKAQPVLRNDDRFENISSQLNDEDTPDNSTVVSESMIDDDDMAYRGQNTGSRKRKRVIESEVTKSEEEHRNYADALLDYFMLHGHDGEAFIHSHPPTPPSNFQVDRAIDTQGHTALHWAAAMGEIDVVKDLIRRGADLEVRNIRGETPLIRAALFANCFEKGCMPKMVQLLQDTLKIVDDFNGSVLHHVAHTAHSCSKTKRAQHYLKVLLNKLSENSDSRAFHKFLSIQDTHGDTAFHIAARNSKRCTRVFQGVGAPSDIPNHNNETVDQYLQRRMKSYSRTENYQTSSSPPQPDSSFFNGRDLGPGEPPSSQYTNLISLPAENLHTQSARSFSESINTILRQRATEIVQAVESEMQEKEDALNEGTRLLRNVAAERENVRQQTLALATEVPRDDDLHAMREELSSLQKYAEAIEEQSQHATLHALVRGKENEAVTLTNQSNGKPSNEDDVSARIVAARLLWKEQERRRELVGEIVRGRGDARAGINSEKGEMLMRLVSGSLGVEERDLLSLLPEMVIELENAAVGGEGAGVGEDEGIVVD